MWRDEDWFVLAINILRKKLRTNKRKINNSCEKLEEMYYRSNSIWFATVLSRNGVIGFYLDRHTDFAIREQAIINHR